MLSYFPLIADQHSNTPAKREERIIAKNRNTFAKRARETEKKRKADEKRASRREKKEQPNQEIVPAAGPPEENADEHNLTA